MSDLSAGKDILAYCSKCKLNLSHIIVVMKTKSVPGKVTCNTCKSTHAFKAEPKKKVTRKKTTRKKARPLGEIWEETIKKIKSEPIKYSIKTVFTIGQVLDHPKFGIGVVEKIIDETKMEIMFQTEMKILMHSK